MASYKAPADGKAVLIQGESISRFGHALTLTTIVQILVTKTNLAGCLDEIYCDDEVVCLCYNLDAKNQENVSCVLTWTYAATVKVGPHVVCY